MKLADIMNGVNTVIESLNDVKKHMALILQGNHVVLKVLSDIKAGQEQPNPGKQNTAQQQEALGLVRHFIDKCPEPYMLQMKKYGDIKKSLEVLGVKL